MIPKSPFLVGFLGALVAVLVSAALFVVVLTFVRASHGELAYEYILHVQQAQQAQQQRPAPQTPPK